jgi:hypothetical protein
MTTNTGNCILLLAEAGDTMSECCETHHHGLFTSAGLTDMLSRRRRATTMIHFTIEKAVGK